MEHFEKYPWETDSQFKARITFIETHRHTFNLERLAALSSSWCNWKFHGCIYCRSVQGLLQQLDKELPESLNAAIKRALSSSRPKKIEFKKQSDQSDIAGSALINGFIIYDVSKSNYPDLDVSDQQLNPISVLNESAQKSRKTIEFQDLGSRMEENGETLVHSTAVFIDGKLIATGTSQTKKLSKHACANKALEILRKTQPIVYKKLPNHERMTKVEKTQLTEELYRNSEKIEDSNIGNKMLRKMGWTGNGGLSKGGIADPVFVESADGRKGFGHESNSIKIQKGSVEGVLLKFITDGTENEIKFSSDLSNDDRKLVHQLSQRFGLKHKSFGKGEDRYIVVSRKLDCEVLNVQREHIEHKPIWV